MKTFPNSPAVVSAFFNDVHFLEFVLADIPGPQLPGLPIEAHAPNITEAISPNFFANAFTLSNERVVFRDPVLKAARPAVHINAQNLSQNRIEALPIVVGIVSAP